MATLQIFTDGGARGNPGPSGIGVHVIDETGTVVFELGKAIGDATNNEAEYQAFLASLEWVQQVRTAGSVDISRIEWKLDSMLVVNQLNKKWKIKEPRLAIFAQTAWAGFQVLSQAGISHTVSHVYREQNREADRLVNAALDGNPTV